MSFEKQVVKYPVEFAMEYNNDFINNILLPCLERNLSEGYSYYKNIDNNQFVWCIMSGIKSYKDKISTYKNTHCVFYLIAYQDKDNPYDLTVDPLKVIANKIIKELNLIVDTEEKTE